MKVVKNDLDADVVIDYNKTSVSLGTNTIHSDTCPTKSLFQTIRQDHGEYFIDLVMDCVSGYYYYDDLCRHMQCVDPVTGNRTVYTTIAPPGSHVLTYSGVLSFAWYFGMNKIKSWLSSSYPPYYFFSTSPDNPPHLKFVVEEALKEGKAYEKIPLVVFKLEELNVSLLD